ncbi:DUF1983 domain-containing protein [Escherichia coli]|uniref:phage tail tip domain-containing protein n=1 Tax=Escherichia coli TaxID=562 RepID=UPI0022763CA0|nr:DUF1983 domain-containing protein [Escherichia coli]EKF0509592.1 DUF1983 domain-containing protein [Escherichia coli]EKP2612777.1 DUF1983 domain-containing protein [Escherichia coli]EKP2829892.1 DUF1983 domain-containing protein [Escherichia coli]ELJ2062057.1 DUF1983 domain-containing protein [Escherichia coli]MDZ4970088.1 DUF1983 domain-containing protein [Escherichia coli]
MGKGGGKGHTPREAKDNLKSTQMMSVIDAIGEGPVEGPVKGLQSILVNKTPLTDTDGNPVIHGVTAVWRAGEQEQTPPEGFESSGAETALGVEVTKAKPVTRTITSANIDRLRVTFGVQSLVETTSKGDRNPSSVRLLIQLERNGNWVTEKDITINGKTTSQYLTSVILNNLPERPFNIRMVRETADSTTDQLQNRTLWSSYTEIIDVKQCYLGTGSQWSVSGPHIKPGKDFWFYVRSVNLVGKSAFVEASGRASNDAEGYLGLFREKIGKLHLAQGMWELIDNSQLDDEMAEMKTTITETRNEITQTVSKTLEDQSATIQQIQRVQTDTNNDLAALYMLKVQKTKNGIPYVAGIGAGIEDADGQPLSNILLQADRIAMINPENGNTTPLFVAQGNQLFMNDVFLKRLFAVSITSSGEPPTFSLTPDGKLTARNADISGNINANSGTLNNVVIAENCTINGTLKAENIIGDLVKCAGVAFPVDGSYLANGTRTLTVYDDHSFDRQIIIPPIIYVGSKQESRTSNDIWTECFLHVDQNGRRIYSGRSVTEPGIFSGIIDMPAGHGHITLSFTVSSRRQNGSFGSSRISNLQAIVVKKNSAGISIR